RADAIRPYLASSNIYFASSNIFVNNLKLSSQQESFLLFVIVKRKKYLSILCKFLQRLTIAVKTDSFISRFLFQYKVIIQTWRILIRHYPAKLRQKLKKYFGAYCRWAD
ncbi:hypothetical protein, partial [Testudinibacter aquarius]|uniref:hypothetical protein n=1 Tax=Testudinibacter aquarius TaxID=1524974 RepID=UPI001C3F3454